MPFRKTSIISILPIIVMSSLALAQEPAHSLASCPAHFIDSSTTKPQWKLEAAEIWSDYLSLQEPYDSATGYFSQWDISPKGDWSLRCKYQADHEIIIDLPPQTTECRSGRLNKTSPYQAYCTGPTAAPQPMADARHIITYSANLKGFMLEQTPEEITKLAISQNGKTVLTNSPEGILATIHLDTTETMSVLFDKNNRAQYVEWSLPKDSLRTAVLQFGFFDTFGNEPQMVIWSRYPGIEIKVHWSSQIESGNTIRLQRQN